MTNRYNFTEKFTGNKWWFKLFVDNDGEVSVQWYDGEDYHNDDFWIPLYVARNIFQRYRRRDGCPEKIEDELHDPDVCAECADSEDLNPNLGPYAHEWSKPPCHYCNKCLAPHKFQRRQRRGEGHGYGHDAFYDID